MNFLYQSTDGNDLIWSQPANKYSCTLVIEETIRNVILEKLQELRKFDNIYIGYRADLGMNVINNLTLSAIEQPSIIISNSPISLPSTVNISGSASNKAKQYIAYQRHLCTSEDIPTGFSLGDLRSRPSLLEPILRDHSVFSFSLDAVKKSELNLSNFGYPTGLTTEEACQIARYCGEATEVKIFNIVIPENMSEASWQIVSYMIWYFLEGINIDNKIHPSNSENFQTFIVESSDHEYSYHFLKSPQGKIWLEISNGDYISCSMEELEITKNSELPHRLLELF